jgi:hypothetical protein
MSMIEGVPNRTYDPVQTVLALLPDGMYGTYEGLMNHMLLNPAVPMNVKEGLRYLSAVTTGCEFCRTFREVDSSGERLLSEDFYVRVAEGDLCWDQIAPAPWSPIFELATEVLSDKGEIKRQTLESAKNTFSDAQIVESLFYMLLVGASHRLSHALGIPAVCNVPARPATAATTPDYQGAL